MKQNYRFLIQAVTLGSALVLTGCYDKAHTVELQEELDKAGERIQFLEKQKTEISNACNELGKQLSSIGAKRDELASSASKSTNIRSELTQYRERLEKEVNTLSEQVAKYRANELKP